MNFVNTIWLWGLGALLIPVLIHFWNRKQSAIIPFGSIRFLTESTRNKSKSIQFKDLWLLIVRMLLLACIVLFLAGLHIKQRVGEEKWLLIGEGIDLPQAYKMNYDHSIPFGELAASEQPTEGWSFLQQLAQEHSEIDAVLWIDDFKDIKFLGAIPRLPFQLRFVQKDPSSSAKQLVSPADTLKYAMEGLPKKDSILIARCLNTLTSYTDGAMVFQESKEHLNFSFSLAKEGIANADVYFIFREHLQNASRIEYTPNKKLITISQDLLNDERKHQALLLILAENLAQYQAPSFEMVADNMQDEFPGYVKGGLTPLAKWPFSDELFIVFALLLLLVERYMVYRKSLTGE